MLIDIQARDFSLTDALNCYTKQQLHASLARMDERVHRIVVRLSDINGPRGGKDKRCHLRVVLRGMPDLVAVNTESDLYAAINRATSRVGPALGRRIKRYLPRRGHTRAADDFGQDGPPITNDVKE